MDKLTPCFLMDARSPDIEERAISNGQCLSRQESPLPRFKGVLLCRRCDLCGTRISFKGEAKDRLVLKCPACQKEYIFFERLPEINS